ncbi:MAG: hypothetical protein M1820_000181 [Bogoriella megaspora]|nr:MAG: hypothetical protein M1820_000181 [Bogoriella megaspora]
MLSWLTGPRLGEDPKEEGNTSIWEAPETPAPVFAARAFQHALFGTPKPSSTTSNTPAQHDQNEEHQAQSQNIVQNRSIDRPRRRPLSTGQFTMGTEGSPYKPHSILMTPGAGAARRKTVSFGAQVADNEDKFLKTQTRSGLPDSFPGKYPSPWIPKTVESHGDLQAERGRTTKLTQTLQKVRESSQSRTRQEEALTKKKEEDLTEDMSLPKSQSGQFWKQEYEQFSTKSKREMKKLVTKQKLAKSYAKQKDDEVLKLVGILRDERHKVQKLETKSSELESQMQEYRTMLARAKSDLQASAQELAQERQSATQLRNKADSSDLSELQEQHRKLVKELREAREETSTLRIERADLQDKLSRKELHEPRREMRSPRKKLRHTDHDGNQSAVDIWAEAVGEATASLNSGQHTAQPGVGRRTRSAAESSPSRRHDNDYFYTTPKKSPINAPLKKSSPATIKSTKHSEGSSSKRSSLLDPSLPLPPDSPKHTADNYGQSWLNVEGVAPSSPLPNYGMALPVRSTGVAGTAASKRQPISKPPRKDNVVSKKENVKPSAKADSVDKHEELRTRHNDNVQPPATRPSIATKTSTKENSLPQNTLSAASGDQAADTGQRQSSIVGRDGRQISNERAGEAWKRIQERRAQKEPGRPISFR